MTREQWETETAKQMVNENLSLEYINTFIENVKPNHAAGVCEKLIKILKEMNAMAR